MCWPVDRPATHAAAGAAARGGFWFEGITLRLDWEPLREHVLAGGPASHACRRGSGSTRGSGFLFGGLFCGWTGIRCGSGRLTTGVVRHACRLRRDGTRRFWFGGFFCGWTGSRCGSMCWPVDRPATHAAAGAAARGVRGFGGFFHTLWSDETRINALCFLGASRPAL